ncbi:MAG: BREX-1 system adenine-specific DNA-methyltransferase PglX [Chloroflexi bacterium]|nr:BREX-1 system adenine-specific DNA-methyltransferase PglX [Chloroflexota bacterium]
MSFDKPTRAALEKMVSAARERLRSNITEQLQSDFRMQPDGTALPLTGLTEDQRVQAEDLRELLEHFAESQTGSLPPFGDAAFDRLVREIGFTILNRLAALRLCEERGLVQECVRNGMASEGFRVFDSLASGALGTRYTTYRIFLENLFDELALDLGSLFDRHSPLSHVFPSERALEDVLKLLNDPVLAHLWREDETIGWIYQYYNDAEERRKMRDESQAPRNSRELAVRNQFFTPRYVVEFLTDNTLGRIWYEMRHGDTRLTEDCRYLVRRKLPIFLNDGERSPEPFAPTNEWGDPDGTGEMWVRPNPELHGLGDIWHYALSVGGYHYAKEHLGIECAELANPRLEKYQQTHKWEGTFEELRCCLFYEQRRWRHFGYDPEGEDLAAIFELYKTVCARWDWEVDVVPFREKKDPRKILMLDPAGGSGHFGLYCFDLFETIYAEAYDDPDLGPALHEDYPRREDFLRRVPVLILANNLHIIDIDPRAGQIAALALWLRAQRSFQQMGLKPAGRPQIQEVNVVCAEPMPGDRLLLDEFIAELKPRVLADLVRIVFEKMKLAGEAGSLLKIEEELKGAISDAKRQWLHSARAEQLALFEGFAKPPKPEQLELFDLSGISDESFWETAETRVSDALRAYAEHATNGRSMRRQLFADDAKHGFAFIDLCQKRYDVLLMNPPFGLPSENSVKWMLHQYPAMKTELGTAFIERAIGWLSGSGRVGVLHPRNIFFIGDLIEWRRDVLLHSSHIGVSADLGLGVLDEALIEVAATVMCKLDAGVQYSLFVRLLSTAQKDATLLESITSLRKNANGPHVFQVNPQRFTDVPGYRLPYWLTDDLLKKYTSLPPFGDAVGVVRQGFQTGDDFRFLRAFWEVEDAKIGQSLKWVPISKGGEYSPYIDSIHLLVDWENGGEDYWQYINPRTGRPYSNIWMLPGTIQNFFFHTGAAYPQRTTSGFAPKLLPRNSIFSHVSMTIFTKHVDDLFACLALTNSRVFSLFVEAGIGGGDTVTSGSAARRYTQNIIESIPCPDHWSEIAPGLSELADRIVKSKVQGLAFDETSFLFTVPFLLSKGPGGSLLQLYSDATASEESRTLELLELTHAADDLVGSAYELSQQDQEILAREIGPHPCQYGSNRPLRRDDVDFVFSRPLDQTIRAMVNTSESVRQLTKKVFFADRRLEVASHFLHLNPNSVVSARREVGVFCQDEFRESTTDLIGYSVGVVFGHWDVRLASDSDLRCSIVEASEYLPTCQPGSLIGTNGLPASRDNIVSKEWLRARPNAITLPPAESTRQPKIIEGEYPVHIAWDGILVDDAGLDGRVAHASDVLRGIRSALSVLWGDRADTIEAEACEILGVRGLRDYFQSPSGFFADHLKRYSKSRRQAPIYWPLSTSSGSYTVWVYYHRLTKDTLYTIVTQYVNPKIESVQKRADQLAEKLESAAGRAATDWRDQLNDTKQFLSELDDFRAELLRVAELPYRPDLDDGVIINAAPLNKLFRLRKWANDTAAIWKKLEAGEYDWAHMAYNMWPKRVEKKCETDRSIAIAHGLEHLCRAEVKKAKKARKRKEEDEDEESD